MKYRAWGALKGMSYGNGLGLSLTYTAAAAPDEFKVSGQTTQMWMKYSRYDDGMLKSVEDKLHHQSDRSYRYDYAGRLEEAFSGTQALSFVKPAPSNTVPYWQKYEYDAWGNTKKRENQYWSQEDTYTAEFDTRNRRYNENGLIDAHDAEGNVVGDPTTAYAYDAAEVNLLATDDSASSLEQRRDGAGQIIKRREEQHDEQGQVSSVEVGYYVRSSVLGGAVVSELDEQGGKVRSRVYAGGEVLAELLPGWVTWRHEEAATGARGESNRDGQFADTGRVFDPTGVNLGAGPPLIIPGAEPTDAGNGVMSLLGGLPFGRCSSDGLGVDCLWASQMRGDGVSLLRGSGSVYECATGDCGERIQIVRGRRRDGSYFGPYMRVVRPGDRGWDGSLDGTYARHEGTNDNPFRDWGFSRMGGGENFSGTAYAGGGVADPQQPQPVHIPLRSITELRDLMQERLKYSDCGEAVAKLIAQLSKDGAAKGNAATDADVMTVFNRIASAGGVRINVPTYEKPPPRHPGEKPVAGGLGYSWRDYKHKPDNNNEFIVTEKMWLYTMPAGYADGPSWNVERVPYEYGITGIHESLHHIGKDMYEEGDLDKAARKLGGGSVDSYLRNHCSPPKYR